MESYEQMYLKYFTDDESFPFFIQYGEHEDTMFIHSHKDFNELVIVMDGSAIHVVGGEEYIINKGDVFVVGNDTFHGYKNAANLRICNIMYRHELFSAAPDITQSAGFHALFVLEPSITKEHGFQSRLKLKHDDYESVKHLTDRMLSEYNGNTECRKTMLISEFMSLSVMLSRLYGIEKFGSEQDIINIAYAVSYIENHFAENISVTKLAELSHYSESHFIRMFSRTYHSTPLEYIIDLRINHACIMLKNTALTVSETAERCGFDDSNYFSRIFRKRIGCSPTEYRSRV
jgi:AraC-like DNA-binding protein